MSFDEKVPKLSTLKRYDYGIIENELTKRGWRLPNIYLIICKYRSKYILVKYLTYLECLSLLRR